MYATERNSTVEAIAETSSDTTTNASTKEIKATEADAAGDA